MRLEVGNDWLSASTIFFLTCFDDVDRMTFGIASGRKAAILRVSPRLYHNPIVIKRVDDETVHYLCCHHGVFTAEVA